jgi:lethal(2) giant larvae protein
LCVFSEEELVAVDLKVEGWPLYDVPYLHSIHASAITCLAQVSQVSASVLESLKSRSGRQPAITSNPWPVSGGVVPTKVESSQGLLLTGHEDGSVRFWGLAGNVLTPLTVFKTAKLFKVDDLGQDGEEERQNGEEEEEEEEEWPPFRKVGLFDPYSDDPRLAVKKLAFCGESGRLVVGGTAGQVVVSRLAVEPAANSEESSSGAAVKTCKADIVTEKEGFTWKGHQPLATRAATVKHHEEGWQLQVILQISPPASITALTLHREWGILAAGTAHGCVVLDYAYGHVVSARSTLNAQDIANADDNPMSRRKSLKKSLRESFRRLRKGRSQRHADKKKNTGTSPSASSGDVIKRELRAESPEARPVERQIEARGTNSEDGLGSMVRCLHFAQTFIAGPTTTSPTLWVGTNSGQVREKWQTFHNSRVVDPD